MDYRYQTISKAWPGKFLTSQADNLSLAVRDPIGLATNFVIAEASIQNRSGSTVVAGIGGRYPIALWKAGQWVNATTTYTDDTTDAQSAAANDVALTTLTVNNGIIILCQVPFNIVSVVVGTAATGDAVYDLAYSKAGGTWTTLTNPYVAPSFAATGEQLIWFEEPTDWAVTEAGHATGITTGYYGIRVRATTAPTVTAALGDLMTVGKMFFSTESVTDNIILGIDNNIGELYLPPQCDAICAAISAANVQNRVTLKYRMAG